MSEAVAGAVRIYPVPSSGTVTVVPPYGIGSYDYAVFDGVGRLVLQGRSAGGALQVDLTGRLSGTYTVKLISGPAVTTGRFWYYE